MDAKWCVDVEAGILVNDVQIRALLELIKEYLPITERDFCNMVLKVKQSDNYSTFFDTIDAARHELEK